jgi:hypothetical protein
MARADALRDAEDKTRAQLERVDRRLRELRSEQDVDRQVTESLTEDKPNESDPDAGVAGTEPGGLPGSTVSRASDPVALADAGSPPMMVSPELAVSDQENIEQLARDRASLAAQLEALHREALEAEGRAQAVR